MGVSGDRFLKQAGLLPLRALNNRISFRHSAEHQHSENYKNGMFLLPRRPRHCIGLFRLGDVWFRKEKSEPVVVRGVRALWMRLQPILDLCLDARCFFR